MVWEAIQNWFWGLGTHYGVNPLIFGIIYVGAIPFFSFSIGWLIRNFHQKKSVVLPALFAIFFFLSAYLYLLFVGKNVPLWVYFIVILLIIFGIFSTIKKIRKQIIQKVGEN